MGSPAGPDCVNASALSHIDNHVDVGIVVVVGASRHFDVLVSHSDVVGIDPAQALQCQSLLARDQIVLKRT